MSMHYGSPVSLGFASHSPSVVIPDPYSVVTMSRLRGNLLHLPCVFILCALSSLPLSLTLAGQKAAYVLPAAGSELSGWVGT